MTQELLIAIELAHVDWGRKALQLAKSLPGVKAQQWTEKVAEKGETALKSIPDIIAISDHPEHGSVLNRIQTIKRNFPQAFIFVVSADQDPQQIIRAMKAGAAEYLVEPLEETGFLNAIEEVRAKMANSGRLVEGSIYSFISAKGGLGATVLAVNAAVSMAQGNKARSVGLIDLSFQSGDASVLLDVVPQTTIMDISRNFHRLDVSFLRGTMTQHSSGLHFLAAPPDPEDADDVTAEHLGVTLDLVGKIYEHVFLDCSSMNISACNVEAFKRSEKIFVVTDMSLPSVRNTVRLFKLIRKLGIRQEKIEIIINRYIKNAPVSLGTIEKNFTKPVYWLIPNDFTDVVTSINQGTPLVKMKPGATFSKNIEEFSKKLLHQLDDAEYRGIRGKFGRKL